jgi:hypothetical protein
MLKRWITRHGNGYPLAPATEYKSFYKNSIIAVWNSSKLYFEYNVCFVCHSSETPLFGKEGKGRFYGE